METTAAVSNVLNRIAPVSVALMITGATLAACDQGPPAPQECLAPSQVADGAPVTRFPVRFAAGMAPVTPGVEVSLPRGATVRPSKARFYLSGLTLIDGAGTPVPTELVDESGNRMPYGVALVDFERPASMNLYLRAPAGSYRGLSASVGVPATCETGERLNHSDASAMKPPLDVDTDMYWSWNSGYVFLKFEGQVRQGDGWDRFFYHTGEEKRFATTEMGQDFAIAAGGGSGPTIVADFDRLLTAPTGEARPDIMNVSQRRVHGGGLADALADNIRQSGFLSLQP